VLLWTGPSDRVRIAGENTVAHVLRRSTIFAFAGYVCIAARLGFRSLLAVPVYWLSLPIVVVSVIVWIGVRIGASLPASGDQSAR
jgi:predicted membrane-bound mannosyltransferase